MNRENVNIHVSQEEEDMIDGLFFKCDTNNEGRVRVHTVIQFLTNCLGNESNESDLLELSNILEAESLDGTINLPSYRDGVKHWILDIKSRCDRSSNMDTDARFGQIFESDSFNITNNSCDISQYSVEASGVQDSSSHMAHDPEILLAQVEDLKYQNRKLAEENGELHRQLEAQEESSTGLVIDLQSEKKETDTLRKKIKSLQKVTDLQKTVMEENEELKSKLASLQEGKRELDKKLSDLEEEKHSVEKQAKSLDSLWQKAVSELEEARQELEKQNVSHNEQKKEKEMLELSEKLKEALSQNEKLQDGKDEAEQKLTQAKTQFLRAQNKADQLGLTDVSLTEDEQSSILCRQSPKINFSTPRTRNSICMEVKDRLNEDRHLPSPFCEKLELSNDLPLYRRSVVLPAYMSAWEFDATNASLQESSRDLKKNRKSMSPDYFDKDVERKLMSIKNWEKDAIQKELINLYRVNLDLAEKCHKAELRETELQEIMRKANNKTEESLQEKQLEESFESIKIGQEIDLWRLVHNPEEEDSDDTEKSIELSASTEKLRLLVKQEIESLRNKLQKREAELGCLRSERAQMVYSQCKGRSSSSPLIDALDITHVNKTNKLSVDKFDCSECHKLHTDYPKNRSVPLLRRHGRVYSQDNYSDPLYFSSSDMEYSRREPNENVTKKNKSNIPVRFSFERRIDSESLTSQESLTPCFDVSMIPLSESDRNNTAAETGHLFRRSSYHKAIENQAGSVEDDNVARCRSYSFQSAVEQGQISPTGPPQSNTSASSVADTTPESETSGSLCWNGPPKYSSTPHQLSKPITKSVNFHPNTFIKNGNNKSLETDVTEISSKETKEPWNTVQLIQQTELVRNAGHLPNKSSVCNSHNLSVLLEEDTSGTQCSEPNGTSNLGSLAEQDDFSLEVWTLSRTDSSQSNSCSSRDSGHSSSISGLDSDDLVDIKKENVISSTESTAPVQQYTSTSVPEHQTSSDMTPSPPVTELMNKSSLNNKSRTLDDDKKPLANTSYDVNSARNLSPSERILLRFGERSENSQSSVTSKTSSPKQKPNTMSISKNETWSIDSGRSKLKEIGSSKVAKTVDSSDDETGFQQSAQRDMKGPHGEPQKPLDTVVTQEQNNNNSSKESQPIIIMEEVEVEGQGDGPRSISNLAKIRQSHLARRRDNLQQNKMPQLSELSEKDSTDDKNEGLSGMTEENTSDGEESTHMTNGDVVMPSIPDKFLQKLGLAADEESSEELSEQEIENKFSSLSLAFKTDAQTLEKRLEIQERSRDIAEQNVDKELQGLHSGLATLNQICTDPQVREVLAKIQNHIDILEKSTARVSSRAEVYGAIQQEKRMSKAVDIMVQHVENIRRVHEKEHAELEEARKLLQDSRSLGPSTLDIAGGDMLSRRSNSVCQNNLYAGKLSQPGSPLPGGVTPSAMKAIKLLKASRRRVSEVALPKVLGGAGAPGLFPSASMDFCMDSRISRPLSPLRPDIGLNEDEANTIPAIHVDPDSSVTRNDKDPKQRFISAVAATSVKSAVTNTLRRASLEKQNSAQTATTSSTAQQMSRDNSADSTSKTVDVQDSEKRKNMEEDAYKKGYEQGLRASLGKDLTGLREQQNHINESLGEIMDSIDSQMEESKSLKEILVERFNENIPKFTISSWRIRMTMGGFFIFLAFISVIFSLFPAGWASSVEYKHYGKPTL